MNEHLRKFESEGWSVVGNVLTSETVSALQNFFQDLPDEPDGRGGRRNILDYDPIRELASHPNVRSIAESLLGERCRAVRGIYFDKRPEANWKVPWHQDLTIAVQDRAELPGFSPWSIKASVVHVQPPLEIVQNMVAIRLHLDDCGLESGPVRVLPGSHRHGFLGTDEIDDWKQSVAPVDCLVGLGGVLAFHPLILHSSGMATLPSRRRVIHLEYASADLPAPLEWQWAV